MEKRIYREENVQTRKWSGGSTTELAIFPVGSDYLERDFVWRLSTARVEDQESAFTRLPDYDRILMVLDGETVLAHGEERSVRLKAMEQDAFDGAVKTKCFGTMQDYNLMMRKGCKGSLTAFCTDAEAQTMGEPIPEGFSHGSYGIFCKEGYLVVSVQGETDMLKPGQQMVIDLEKEDGCSISVMGEGTGILAEIFYQQERFVPENVPEQKATMKDFQAAFKLLYTRNRWSKVLQKRSIPTVWHDEALQKKLRFLERSCLVFILWAAVTFVLGILVAVGMSMERFLLLAGCWTAVYLLLIAPLIYMMVLPKPISAHRKRVEDLTPYEEALFQQQLGENQEAEKVLKKYKLWK